MPIPKLDLVRDPAARSVDIAVGETFAIRPVDWLWPAYVPRGHLTLLAGAPGVSKTTVALALAATVTKAGKFPDGHRCKAADVLMWSGEDAIESTLLPRLVAMGADLGRLHFVRGTIDNGEHRPFDPAADAEDLGLAASRIRNLALVIVDPVVMAVRGDSNTNGDVRRGLAPLVTMAERLNAALIGITHFSKGSGGKHPTERVTGSLAFGAAARIVLAVARVPEDKGGGRLMLRAKSNLGPDGGGFKFDVRPIVVEGCDTVRLLWGDSVTGDAIDLLDDAEERDGVEERTGIDDAVAWLRDVLREAGGELDRRTIVRLGEDAGHYKRRVERAAGKLGLRTTSRGYGKDRVTLWTLPARS